jgi:hypothetical protein
MVLLRNLFFLKGGSMENFDEQNHRNLLIKIDDLYWGEKSYGFIIHLIMAFLPNNGNPVLEPIKDLRCSVTAIKLFTLSDCIRMDVSILEVKAEIEKRLKGDISSLNIIGNRDLAIECESSKKMLSLAAYVALREWTLYKLIDGDRKINKLINEAYWIYFDENIEKAKKEKHLLDKVLKSSDHKTNKGSGLGDAVAKALQLAREG